MKSGALPAESCGGGLVGWFSARDVPREAIAPPVHGQHGLKVAAVSQRRSQPTDRDSQRIVRNRAARPDLIEQLGFRDQPARVTHENIEQAQDQGVASDRNASAPQLGSGDVVLVVIEAENTPHVMDWPARRFFLLRARR